MLSDNYKLCEKCGGVKLIFHESENTNNECCYDCGYYSGVYQGVEEVFSGVGIFFYKYKK